MLNYLLVTVDIFEKKFAGPEHALRVTMFSMFASSPGYG